MYCWVGANLMVLVGDDKAGVACPAILSDDFHLAELAED